MTRLWHKQLHKQAQSTSTTQVLRRGELKGERKVDSKEVDGRIAQLRAQVKDDQASKQNNGKPDKPKAKAKLKAAGKAKAEWQLPENFSRPLTAVEKELGDVGPGPDLARIRPGQVEDTASVDDPQASPRLNVHQYPLALSCRGIHKRSHCPSGTS